MINSARNSLLAAILCSGDFVNQFDWLAPFDFSSG